MRLATCSKTSSPRWFLFFLHSTTNGDISRTQSTTHFSRRTLLGAAAALGATTLPAMAQSKTVLRISTPAVPEDWHGKMWTVFKDTLDKSAPGEFDVQINLNGALFKQGT